jgi:CBS domain-containing protein
MRMKLLLAASATVFVSVVVGAVVSQVMTPATVTVKASAPTPTASATIEISATATEIATPRPVVDAQTVQQREATYQARLAEANRLIAQSAAELAKAQQPKKRHWRKEYNSLVGVLNQPTVVVAQPTAVPQATTVVVVPTATPDLLPLDVALANAQAIDPNAKLLQKPDMVLYENTVAYEFVFDTGTIYMAAKDGAVVYNGIAVNIAAKSALVAPTSPPTHRTVPTPHNDTVPPPDDNTIPTPEHHHHHDDNGGNDD